VVSDYFCGCTQTDDIENRRATHDVDDDDDDDDDTLINTTLVTIITETGYSGNSPHPHPQKDTDIVLCLIAYTFSTSPLHGKR
jgi:hypothetical protein